MDEKENEATKTLEVSKYLSLTMDKATKNILKVTISDINK